MVRLHHNVTLDKYRTSFVKTFVANRVAEIQDLATSCEWRHVPTRGNPADLVSRGLTPQDFLEIPLWKTGSQWLSLEKNLWPQEKIYLSEIPEKRKNF